MGLLDNKVAIVTGASSPLGLGKAVADRLAAQGAKVALTDLASAREGLDANVGQIVAGGGEAMALSLDMMQAGATDEVVAQVVERFGGVDILVNNAGVGLGSPVLDNNDDKDWAVSYGVHVTGALALCRSVLPHFEAAGSGAIVNVASTAGIGASVGMPYPYVATKHALVGATKVLALEYAPKGIRANVVAPGAINTEMAKAAHKVMAEAQGVTVEEAAALQDSVIPLGRSAEPGEIADAIVYLAGPTASYITGIVLPVAGGLAAGL